MKILVTGGAGYIGSHVVELLIDRGYQVVVFDNLIAGHRQAVHEEAIFVQGDLLNKAEIENLFQKHSFDGILNFASHILVGESMEKPFKYFHDNVLAMINLTDVAGRAGVKRFIFSSTAALFDEPQRMPINETEAVIPGSVYGETKAWGERMLLWMDRIYGMKYCALRYFNACGAHPGGHIGEDHHPESHLIPLVIKVALDQRENAQIFGTDYDTPDGTCIRDYVHVIDLAEAHILALEALSDGVSRAYNLGSGTGYSVRQVIETVRQVTGQAIPAVETKRRAGDLPILIADSRKIKQELGWQPEFDNLYKIVETAWHWHKNHPNGFED